MKPSEKRALEAEKLKKEISGESENTAKASDENSVPYKRKEGFFQSHVRLITFIICVVLILTVLGPWAIDTLVARKRGKIIDNKQSLTVETVIALADKENYIEWRDLEKYNYTDRGYSTPEGRYEVREYPILRSDIVLSVGGKKASGYPDYVRLIYYRGGKHIDLRKGSAEIRAFIESVDD